MFIQSAVQSLHGRLTFSVVIKKAGLYAGLSKLTAILFSTLPTENQTPQFWHHEALNLLLPHPPAFVRTKFYSPVQ